MILQADHSLFKSTQSVRIKGTPEVFTIYEDSSEVALKSGKAELYGMNTVCDCAIYRKSVCDADFVPVQNNCSQKSSLMMKQRANHAARNNEK